MKPNPSFRSEVIVDARMIRHSGIGTYVRGLAGEFQRHSFFKDHILGLALPPPLFSERGIVEKIIPFHSSVYSVQEQMEYPMRLKQCRLWHAPHYNIPLLKGKAQLVVTVHDLIHWIFKNQFYSPAEAAYAWFFFRRLAHSADRIIAVSKRTRDDLIQHFKVAPEKIRVIYEGVSEDFFEIPDASRRRQILSKYHLSEPFFLYVGLLKPHKNVNRLLRVFAKLRAQGKTKSSLVVVGKKDRKYPKGFELTEGLKTGNGVYYFPQVDSREELACLYASAQALVHPSLYEGFGLTCLEAMASGTPVTVSRAASLPEVVGEAGHYFDPYSDDSLSQALIEMEKDERMRKELAEKGKLRARQFSWAKTAVATIQVYQELLES